MEVRNVQGLRKAYLVLVKWIGNEVMVKNAMFITGATAGSVAIAMNDNKRITECKNKLIINILY